MEAESISFSDEDLARARDGKLTEDELIKLLSWSQKEADRFKLIWERKLAEGSEFDLNRACIETLETRLPQHAH